jgi:hypothetical protein
MKPVLINDTQLNLFTGKHASANIIDRLSVPKPEKEAERTISIKRFLTERGINY